MLVPGHPGVYEVEDNMEVLRVRLPQGLYGAPQPGGAFILHPWVATEARGKLLGIKAIIFDAGGVLLTLGETEYQLEVISHLGPHVRPEHYESKIPALQRGEESEERVACAAHARHGGAGGV